MTDIIGGFRHAEKSWRNFIHRVDITEIVDDEETSNLLKNEESSTDLFIYTALGFAIQIDGKKYTPLLIKSDVVLIEQAARNMTEFGRVFFVLIVGAFVLANGFTSSGDLQTLLIFIGCFTSIPASWLTIKCIRTALKLNRQLKEIRYERPKVNVPNKAVIKGWKNFAKSQGRWTGAIMVSEGLCLADQDELALLWDTLQESKRPE